MKLIKLVERFLSEPSEVRFEEARHLLKAFEFIEARSKGSHHTFRDGKGRVQIIPKVWWVKGEANLCQADCALAQPEGMVCKPNRQAVKLWNTT